MKGRETTDGEDDEGAGSCQRRRRALGERGKARSEEGEADGETREGGKGVPKRALEHVEARGEEKTETGGHVWARGDAKKQKKQVEWIRRNRSRGAEWVQRVRGRTQTQTETERQRQRQRGCVQVCTERKRRDEVCVRVCTERKRRDEVCVRVCMEKTGWGRREAGRGRMAVVNGDRAEQRERMCRAAVCMLARG